MTFEKASFIPANFSKFSFLSFKSFAELHRVFAELQKELANHLFKFIGNFSTFDLMKDS